MIRRLYFLYDARCGICSRLRSWVHLQPAHVTFEFIPAGSDRARELFPSLHHDEQPEELIAVSDEGALFAGNDAWIVCLWALREYRDLSYRIARGPLRPLARAVWSVLSANRLGLSAMLSPRSDAEVAHELEARAQSCETA